MAETVLTNEQILNKLNTDADFGLQFIIQNQPNIVIDRLKEAGYDKAHTPEGAYELLTVLLKSDPKKVGEILNNIPYESKTENFTGGFEAHFNPAPVEVSEVVEFGMPEKSIVDVAQSSLNTTSTSGGGSFDWGGILSGIGSLTGIIGSFFGGSGTTLTAQQQQMLLMEQQRQQELERQRRNRNALMWGIVAVVVLIVIVLMYNASKKKK